MRWKPLERSGNVEDRRLTPMVVGGGVGLVAFIVALIVFVIPGGDDPNPLDALQRPSGQTGGTLPPEELEAGQFVAAVVGTTETYWTAVFNEAGLEYPKPTVVLFVDATGSECGIASAAVGPHYCPVDETIYLDLGFFDDLEVFLGAGGDFAEAYVIAHEVGHHVQNVLGITEEVADLQAARPSRQNDYSVKLELQADCLAGNWADSLFQRGDVLESGDIEEAFNAAAAVGDDRIQAQTGDQVNPESWTHGSSQQRVEWFTTGYQTGDPAACNTFAQS
jgi:hypothetical protein